MPAAVFESPRQSAEDPPAVRNAEGGYLNVLAATAHERVRPEPFGAVEFLVASFFDDAEDDEA